MSHIGGLISGTNFIFRTLYGSALRRMSLLDIIASAPQPTSETQEPLEWVDHGLEEKCKEVKS